MWVLESKPFMDETFSPSKNPLERIADYLHHIYLRQNEIREKHGKVLGCPIMSMGTETSTQEIAQVNAKVRELFARKRRYYESAIRDAVAEKIIPPCDPSEKACALASVIDGMLCQCRVLNDLSQLGSLPSIGLGLLGAQVPASASKA
jgi:TetR/AcrR family transcriptional repressor of nem operon